MTTYTIDYNTGITDTTCTTLRAAKMRASRDAAYTQQPITIYSPSGEMVARRDWVGCMDGYSRQKNPIGYGNGYYADWESR